MDVLLLNNLTRLDEGSRQLLQLGEPSEGFCLEKLTEILTSAKEGEDKTDLCSWVARVLLNMSQLPEARKFLLEENGTIFKQLLKDIQHHNLLRKRAVLGIIKCGDLFHALDYFLSDLDHLLF